MKTPRFGGALQINAMNKATKPPVIIGNHKEFEALQKENEKLKKKLQYAEDQLNEEASELASLKNLYCNLIDVDSRGPIRNALYSRIKALKKIAKDIAE